MKPPCRTTPSRKRSRASCGTRSSNCPDNYREPLVLYYREYQSIEHVAVQLELTEDTVKQRLSRGRKMLKEQALAFVEGALVKSTPGKVFTMGVLASLPAFSPAGAGRHGRERRRPRSARAPARWPKPPCWLPSSPPSPDSSAR